MVNTNLRILDYIFTGIDIIGNHLRLHFETRVRNLIDFDEFIYQMAIYLDYEIADFL